MRARSAPLLILAAGLLLPLAGIHAELPASDAPPRTNDDKLAFQDVIPLTVGNLRGHKMLYDEGWTLITSSEKALEYARQKSVVSSKTAILNALKDSSSGTSALGRNIKTDMADSARSGAAIASTGTAASAAILENTRDLARSEFAYADGGFKEAAKAFVRGNLSIVRRTEDDRRELAALPGGWFKDLKSDFSNIYETAAETRRRFAGKIDPAWEKSFRQASREFKAEYEKSGGEKNSLAALGPILRGWLQAFYHGFAAPAAKTIVKTTVAGTSFVVFLPSAGATVVTGRTVQSIGLTVYYAGRTGIQVLSPTVEGGLLSGLSLLSFGAAPVTYAAGGALGAVNQVAFTAVAPAAASVQAAASTGWHAGSYVGLVVYDAATGASKVAIYQAESGVVLGYNAMTALPAQTLMGTGDAAVFLAWDGPRLVIAAARGRLRSPKDRKSWSLGELPAGTVVDLKKLERTEGVKVEPLSTDPAVIQAVLQKIPADAREPNAER